MIDDNFHFNEFASTLYVITEQQTNVNCKISLKFMSSLYIYTSSNFEYYDIVSYFQ